MIPFSPLSVTARGAMRGAASPGAIDNQPLGRLIKCFKLPAPAACTLPIHCLYTHKVGAAAEAAAEPTRLTDIGRPVREPCRAMGPGMVPPRAPVELQPSPGQRRPSGATRCATRRPVPGGAANTRSSDTDLWKVSRGSHRSECTNAGRAL